MKFKDKLKYQHQASLDLKEYMNQCCDVDHCEIETVADDLKIILKHT